MNQLSLTTPALLFSAISRLLLACKIQNLSKRLVLTRTMIMLITSPGISVWEIQSSVKALDLHLSHMEL